MFFGYFACVVSFLHNIFILPLKMLYSIFQIARGKERLLGSQNILKGVMIAICCYALMFVDPSRLYHSIRGQSTVKLYVIFNVLEIADRLCCSFGLDILDSFFSYEQPKMLNPFFHFFLSNIYLVIHSLILFYQAITLNVSINSFNNALLTLLISNQFVEIKSSVFKKFEKENLFQLCCSGRLLINFQILWKGFNCLFSFSSLLCET